MRVVVAFVLTMLAALKALAQPITTQLIATGEPYLFVTAPDNDFSRLFLVSQSGRIFVFDMTANQRIATPFLIVPSFGGGEGGLLGMAFHPDYVQNGCFYVYYTAGDARVVARYRVSSTNPNQADPSTATDILKLPMGGGNLHYGGWIGFGPDDFLYVAWGNSGSGFNSQNIQSNLLGKILRLDVDGPDGVPATADDDGFPADANKCYRIPATNPFASSTGDDEIWTWGLRNPFRCSFDRDTGDLWIGDVGDNREEIDVVPSGQGAGWNFGYPCRDGDINGLGACAVPPATVIPPLFPYQRPGPGSSAVIGGYVYRGCAIPSLRGRYIFGDYGQRFVWSFRWMGSGISDFLDLSSQIPTIGLRSFGEDARGELYVCHNNAVYRIVPATPDCNGNGQTDGCEITAGTAPDVNNNFIIDSCERPWPCYADYNQDGDFGTDADIEDFFACLAGTCCIPCGTADFNGDGDVGTDADIEAFFRVLAGQPC